MEELGWAVVRHIGVHSQATNSFRNQIALSQSRNLVCGNSDSKSLTFDKYEVIL
jgi:hypothetical protein